VGEFLYFRLAPNEFQVYQYFSTVLYIFENLNKGACVLPLKLILSFEQMTNDIFMFRYFWFTRARVINFK